MSSNKKSNLKEIQALLNTDNALSIFQDLLGEKPRNKQLVRLFDDTKTSSEKFRDVKDTHHARIQNYKTREHYTAVNAYMKAHNLEWKDAVIELGKQYNHLPHDYGNTPYQKRAYTPKIQPTEQERREANYLGNPTFDAWSEEHLAFWQKWNITQALLEQYGVKPLKSFDLLNVETEEHKCTIKTEFAYAYQVGKAYKLYQTKPQKPEYKWSWAGNLTKSNILWGIEQLPEKCTKIAIVEGLKDALCIVANFSEFGIYAVGLDSAGQELNPKDLEFLKSKVSNPNDLFSCLDNDDTGKKQNEAKAQKYGLSYLPYPEKFASAKDTALLIERFEKFVIKEWLLDSASLVLPTNHEVKHENRGEAKEKNIQQNTTYSNTQKLSNSKEKSEYDQEKIYDIKEGEIVINSLKLVQKLYQLGFRRFDMDKNSEPIFVHIHHNIVREVTITNIEDYFFEWLEKNHVDEYHAKLDELKNKLYKGVNSYFSKKLLHRLGTQPNLSFIKDTKDKAFFYFQNGIVEVTQNELKLVPYSQMNGYIWENQILNREFQVLPKEEAEKSIFAQFCELIAKQDYMNFECLQSIIGYILHDFKDNKRKAVNFTDSSLERGNNGRTGKTLLAKALGKLRVYGEINGKNFEHTNKHKYQDLNLDSQFVNLNDVKKGFKLEWIYNDITEGLMVEKKNQMPFRIQPNIVICSNLPLELEGGSDKDRITEFEFSNTFSIHHTPQDHFKHWFFSDWDRQEWNAFDNFMLYCVKFYLKVGMLQPENTNLAKRKLIEFTAPEFVEFIEAQKLKTGVEYEKKPLLQEFTQAYTDFEGVKMKTFTKWIRIYAESTPTIAKMNEGQNNAKQSIFTLIAKHTPENSNVS